MVALERLSFILDFSLFEHRDDEVRFATEFADRLYRKNRNPMLFFVDEADSFIPQMPETREERRMMLRFDVIARRGRKRGIGLVLMTQRSAAIHKGALSQTELLIAHQTSAPQDRLAVVSWMANKGSPEDQRKLMETLPKLKKGRALAWSPGWLQVFKEIGVRPKRTFDSSATPSVRGRRRDPRVLASVDIERLKKHMSETIERADAEDPAKLRTRIRLLEGDLAKARIARPAALPPPTPSRSVRPAPVAREVVRKLEIPVLDEARARRVEKAAERVEKAFRAVQEAGGAWHSSVGDLRASLAGAREAARRAAAVAVATPPKPAPWPLSAPYRPSPIPRTDSDQKPLLAGERKMLGVLVQFNPGTRTLSQLGVLSGFSTKSSTFRVYYGNLRKRGYVEVHPDRSLSATPAGIQVLGGDVDRRPDTPEELLDLWRGKLLAGERRFLDLIVANPEGLTEEDLARESGSSYRSSTFRVYLGTLKRNGLTEKRDGRYVPAAMLCGNAMAVGR